MAARLHRIEKSRTVHHCGKGHEIPKGEGYYWWKFRYGGKLIRCISHPPRLSERIFSDKLSRIQQSIEVLEDAIEEVRRTEDIEDAKSVAEDAIEEAAGILEEVGSDYEESISNMESAFPNGSSVIDEIREKADQCSEVADSWRSIDLDVDDPSDIADALEEAIGADLPA